MQRGGGVNFFTLKLYVASSHLDGKCSPLGELQIHLLMNKNISGPNPYQCVVFIMIYLSHKS